MRFFSSSALASAPKLRFAASCSAAETMFGFLPPSLACDDFALQLVVEHDLYRKTGTHFSGSCSGAVISAKWPEIGQTPDIIWCSAPISPSQSLSGSSVGTDDDADVTPPRLRP